MSEEIEITNGEEQESAVNQLPKQFLYVGVGLIAVVAIVAISVFVSNSKIESDKVLAADVSRSVNIYLSGSKDAAISGSGVTVRGQQVKGLAELASSSEVASLLVAKNLMEKGQYSEAKTAFSSLSSSSSSEIKSAGLAGYAVCQEKLGEGSADSFLDASAVLSMVEEDTPALLYAAIASESSDKAEALKVFSKLSKKDDYLESTGMAESAMARLKYLSK